MAHTDIAYEQSGQQRRRIQLISVAVFLIAWWALSVPLGKDLLPSPWAVLQSIAEHGRDGDLLESLWVTMARVVASFTIAMLIGCSVGVWMGRSPTVDAGLDPILIAALNIPALVVIILCYLWFGLNEVAAVTAVAVNKIPTVIVTVREGARAVDSKLLDVATSYRLPWSRTMSRVVLPQLYPFFMAAARSGLALIWKIVLVVELLGRSNGVGFQLGTFFQFFDITSILAYSIAFAVIIFAIEIALIQPLERAATRWR